MINGILDAVRNLYDAGGGVVPASSWTATVATVMWMASYRDRLAAGLFAPGGEGEVSDETFRERFAGKMGWSDAQVDQFLNDPRYDFNP